MFEPAVSASVAAALLDRAAQTPDRTAYVFLAEGEEEQEHLTYAGLDARARAIAAALSRSVGPGKRALLLYPPGLDFVAAFFGCLYAGVIAVPAYPPRSQRMMPRLLAILADAKPAVAVAAGTSSQRVRGWLERTPEGAAVSWIATDELDPAPAGWSSPAPDGDAVAFLQYTSGSTSTPKGVMVTQANLVHNQQLIQEACGHSEESVFVSWLPVYHDLGLIGNLLQATWVGAPCVLMSPVAFLQKPSRWLRAISRYCGTTSGGPNFAYDLCVRRAAGADLAGIDLSSWQVAFNGAEPVREETLARFAQAFAPAGFRPGALYPCYGLAEATLMVSGGHPGEETVVRDVEERRLVGCGRVLLDLEVAIVDPESGTPRPSGAVGEIWVAGGSVTQGYWNRPEETAQAFGATLADGRGPWLRTGDLGALEGGELFVAGRLKDLIILRGRNHYPQDLEAAAGKAHWALGEGTCAAFAVDVGGEERLVIVQEVERHAGWLDEIAAAIRQVIVEEHEALVYEVALVPAGGVPRTTSGKVQRRACRDLYLQGELRVLGASRLSLAAAANDPLTEALPGSLDWLRQAFAAAARVALAEVDPDRPLSASGLDSLAAVDLKHIVEASTGVSVSLPELLEGMTLRELEQQVAAGAIPPADRHVPEAGEAAGEHPLSWNQRSLWILHRLAPESPAYNIAGAARLHGTDAAAMIRALQGLIDRHPMLRATFVDTPDGPVQRVAKRAEAAFEIIDATGWSEAEIRERLHTEAFRPFDLSAGPLLRAALLQCGGEAFLALAVHHIAADFWSITVLARELGALAAGETLPPPGALYTDFARRQQEMLESPVGERLWEHWRERLAGTPQLDLPTDRPRRPVQTLRGGSRTLPPSWERAEAVHRLAATHGCTPFVVLLAAWQAVLSRWSGQEEFLTGAPMAGRSAREWGEVVGYFVNLVPLRADLSADLSGNNPAVRELMARTRSTVLDALAHQDLPFALLTKRLQPERDPSRPPLVAAMLTYEKAPAPELAALAAFAVGVPGVRLDLGGISLESLPLAPPAAQLDLSLMAAEWAAGLAVSLQWDAALFDEATVERMLGHLDRLLAGIADADRPVAELPLLSTEEHDQLLLVWSGAENGAPVGTGCLHELFEAQAARTPEATALITVEERWTYEELNHRANRLAHHLRRLGAGPEERVGVLLGRSGELVATLLGVLKAGAAYVPLDPSYPADWLSHAAQDAGIVLLLTEARFRGRIAGSREIVCRDEALAHEPEGNPEPLAGPANLAYVMYTSGSTGRPKGVALEHRAPVERMFWARTAFRADALAGVLVSTSICFDLSVFELFAPLSWGGTAILAENALALPAHPAAGEVTLVNTVPSAMAELAAAELPPRLRTVNLAGEALPPPLAERIYRHAQIEQVFNLYGPTEDATYSTWARIERGAPRVTIGHPLPGTRAYVLDRHLTPVPGGVPGELFLAGAGGARGYLNRPDLTAERFLPDPFGELPGGRLYRTGDLARWLASGELKHLGRLDHQVKVRGFRIELEEIERVLRKHPRVREAVVVVRESPAGGRMLAAFVAPVEAGVPELRRHLESRLPAYMIPSSIQLLPMLPRTPNGKVDRKALPAGASPETAFVAPRSPTEEVLAGIWADVLGRERVGIQESFFDLGGHSLLAGRVVARLHAAFAVELPLLTLFEQPTVEKLAEAVEAALQAGLHQRTPPLVPQPRGGALPLSFVQQRLWLIDQLEPGSPLYNMPGALRVEGPLDGAVLALCLGEIVRRHEALRTVFALREGAPVQVIQPAQPFPLPMVDLTGLPGNAREALVPALLREEAACPFNLARGPLLRGVLLRLGEGDHVLALTLHHIASDGWSLGILVREIAVLYTAFATGRPSPLSELPVQYADFALWQHSWLHGSVLESEISFWRRELAGLPPLLELPTDRPRPAVQSFRGAPRPIRLPAGLTRQLEALARREGATLFMVLLAGYQALLARSSGQDDLAVGSPVAGRNRVEVEGLIGFFVNTLVMRGRLAGGLSLRNLLGRVRETALAAWLHQDVPFEKLVEELASERSRGHSPLFQAMLALQKAPFGNLEIRDLRLRRVTLKGRVAKFDLTLSLEEHDGELSGFFEHSTDLFDAVTIDRLSGRFEQLLAAAVAAPENPVLELPLLSPAERHQTLAEWNDTAIEDGEGSVMSLVEHRARERPTDPAVVDVEGRVLVYGELEERAGRLAGFLRTLGVGPETVVGVLAGRSLDLPVGLLGVLKAGAAYVPLDPSYPAERLALMLAETAAPVVLTQEALLDRLPGTADVRARIVCLDRDREEIERFSPLPAPQVEPEGLAYVIYTSGSTGKPKGVQVPHLGLMNLVRWDLRAYGTGPGDHRTHLASLGFDASVWEIWPCLASGAALHLPGEAELLDPPRLAAWIAGRGITVSFLPTPLAEALLAAGRPEIPTLRRLLTGGDRLRLHPDPSWGLALFNHYGPTEASVVTSAGAVPPRPAGEAGSPPSIGRPIDGLRAHLLDLLMLPVPPGVAGELWVGGRSLARGYLGDPGRTAERFVPDPFGEAPGERLYRTGDLCRHRHDGNLEFLGRVDRQVKIRGVRIEPGEIETALLAHLGIRQAAVEVREVAGGKALVAYVAGEEPRPAAAGLREHLFRQLPEHMIPAFFVALPKLPLTPNGKVDRKVLPAPEWQSSTEEFVPPGTPAEELLANLWAELLGLVRVGARDDFFALGGHSLKGAQLASRIRDRFGVALPVRQIFATPILEDLARWLEGELADGARLVPPPVVPVPRQGPLPLSFAQRRLWFMDRYEPGSAANVIPLVLELEGPLRVTALARSLSGILERHEVLRTVFPERYGEPEQVILPATAGWLPVVDLEGLPPNVREPEARSLARREARRPFDLERGPLVRFHLLRLHSPRHVLLGVMHHIVSDGWSLGVLLSEMSALYEGAELAPLAVQYADYAVWQRECLAGEQLDRELSYWRRQLAGVTPLELPTDRARPSLRSSRGASLRFNLPETLGAGVRRFALRTGVTPFMVFLTTFQALLSRLSGQTDLTVGSPVAGRGTSELEGLIGCFINTLVLRGGFEEATTFEAALKSARSVVLEAHSHQEIPFERLVEELQPQRSLSHTPLFQALLTYQESPLSGLRLGETSLLPVWVDRGAAQFDLTLDLLSQGKGYLAGLEYSTGLFDRTTMDRLAGQLERLLSGAVERPESRIAELPLLSEAERHQLFVEWNDSTGGVDEPELVHQMFERQVERSPGQRALTFGKDTLTCRGLNARANRLAHWLIRQGVGPEVRVGIQCERSPEVVVAMLAVHKAGGAYVPMDPSYPQERLALILEDASVSLVLTRHLLDELAGSLAHEPQDNPPAAARPDNAAYVIYTSGSTGRPKGVVVAHRNAASFFAAMDRRLGAGDRGIWFAVTSISFDISVLEILWTLSRGFEVVLQPEAPAVTAEPAPPPPPIGMTRHLEFSLFYFASGSGESEDSYRLLLEGARFADRHGFQAVWTPERHFHAFGGLYPNPAVAGAALAIATERVQIRAGSVVMPLQSPLRVAEEWAVVDRLSGGRVGVSFASGWHADDFVLAPESYGRRKDVMIEGIETVRRLWRGEAVQLQNGVGREVPVRVHPRPLQGELPVWLTAAGNEETFRLAGQLKAGLLTHLLGQSLEELAAKVAVYREAYREAGGEGEGHVTLMLHTFLGDDLEKVRECVRQPFRRYLRNSIGLLRNLASSLGRDVDLDALTPEDEEILLDLAFDRYFAVSGLFGTPDTCLRQLDRLREAGIDEVACLIDFGVETEATLTGLERLHELKERSRASSPALAETAILPLEEQIPHFGVTHLQCTPSMARMLVSEPGGVEALGSLRQLLVGGEALPPALARQLREAVQGEIHNMYGPTETTVWSSAHRLDEVGEAVPIGRPLLNTSLFVLDRSSRPAPPGVPGELFIGGRGVARGYLGRPDLTAERFIPDPFSPEPGSRFYATGDRARFRLDGMVEFLGRVDHQVKIRGHRIELGEIEAVLGEHPAVESAVVAVSEERQGEPVLAAYVVPIRTIRPLHPALPPEQVSSLLAGRQRATLPNGMEIAVLGDFQTQALYQEIFLSRIYLRNGIELRDGDCVFDVGANIGSFTLFASQQARDLQIHAFEPIPPTFETLRVNVGLYGLKAELHNCGLSSRSEEAELTFYPSMSGLSGRYSETERDLRATREIVIRHLRERAGDSALRSVEGEALENLLAEQFRSERHRCRLRTLSEVMRERGVDRIDLLKIDVERAEVDVLQGIEEEDWDKIGQIVMEVDGRDNLETIAPMLERRGFHLVMEELHPDREGTGRSEDFFAHLYARRHAALAVTDVAPVELSTAALRAFLRERLPAYMLPSHLVLLDALPLTPNGKVDRRALPSPEWSRPSTEVVYEAPDTEVQKVIAAAWMAVLQVERVGLHDNFFELGGTSLSLVEVRSRLREALGCEVSLVDLFRSPTVASLALLLGSAAERQAPSFDNARQRARRRRLAVQQRHTASLEAVEMEEETR